MKKFLKNSLFLFFALGALLVPACDKKAPPAPAGTGIEKQFKTSFSKAANVGYPLNLTTTITGKTFWIYIATEKDLLTLSPASSTGGVTPEKIIKFLEIKCNYLSDSVFALDYIFLKYSDKEKIEEKDLFDQPVGDGGTQLYQDFTDAAIEILQLTYSSIGDIIDKAQDMNFFAIVLANTKSGSKVTFVIHRLDVEQFLLGMLPSDEFYNRMIIKTEGSKEIINDKYGLHMRYNDISLVNFLREQIVSNARSVVSEMERYETEKLKSLEKLEDILLESVYEVTTKYEFGGYLAVEVKNIVEAATISLSKSQLISQFSKPPARDVEPEAVPAEHQP